MATLISSQGYTDNNIIVKASEIRIYIQYQNLRNVLQSPDVSLNSF